MKAATGCMALLTAVVLLAAVIWAALFLLTATGEWNQRGCPNPTLLALTRGHPGVLEFCLPEQSSTPAPPSTSYPSTSYPSYSSEYPPVPAPKSDATNSFGQPCTQGRDNNDPNC